MTRPMSCTADRACHLIKPNRWIQQAPMNAAQVAVKSNAQSDNEGAFQ
jgi:hypothetical protein